MNNILPRCCFAYVVLRFITLHEVKASVSEAQGSQRTLEFIDSEQSFTPISGSRGTTEGLTGANVFTGLTGTLAGMEVAVDGINVGVDEAETVQASLVALHLSDEETLVLKFSLERGLVGDISMEMMLGNG